MFKKVSTISIAPNFPAIQEKSFDSTLNESGTESSNVSSESLNKNLDGQSQNAQKKRKNAHTDGVVIKINDVEKKISEIEVHNI